MIAQEVLKRENAKREKYLKQQRKAALKTEMHARNVEVVKAAPLCGRHPKYMAIRAPIVDCVECWAAYRMIQP